MIEAFEKVAAAHKMLKHLVKHRKDYLAGAAATGSVTGAIAGIANLRKKSNANVIDGGGPYSPTTFPGAADFPR